MIRLPRPALLTSTLFFGALVASAALAQDGGFLDQAGQTIDTSLPIEVAADTFEVRQAEQVAIFAGSVDATQGEMRLQAREVQIHYQTGDGSESEITRLDATGEVHVSSPRETARGDWAIYDVLAETVTMGGNVVLTQGPNVIQGDQLTINLATGRSRIEGGPSMVDPAVETSAGDGRVRGLFTIPDDDADDNADANEDDTTVNEAPSTEQAEEEAPSDVPE